MLQILALLGWKTYAPNKHGLEDISFQLFFFSYWWKTNLSFGCPLYWSRLKSKLVVKRVYTKKCGGRVRQLNLLWNYSITYSTIVSYLPSNSSRSSQLVANLLLPGLSCFPNNRNIHTEFLLGFSVFLSWWVYPSSFIIIHFPLFSSLSFSGHQVLFLF